MPIVERIIDAPYDYSIREIIGALQATKYAPPAYEKFDDYRVKEAATGRVINLYGEAMRLNDMAPREDKTAVVKEPAGAKKIVNIPQEVVKASGGDLEKVAASLEKVLSERADVAKAGFANMEPLHWLGLGVLGFIMVRTLTTTGKARER